MKLDRAQNNLAYWFPKLQATGVRVPRTVIVEADDEIVMAVYGKPAPALGQLVEKLTEAARAFGFPVFLRSGYGSGKHEWRDTCFVESAEVMRSHVLAITEWSELVDMIGLPTRTWVVREVLPLEATFRAFHGGMPVNRERRYFFEGGRKICSHPYWPRTALDGHGADCADWEERLAALNHESAEEAAHLRAETERVAAAFDGAWSLDWAQTKDGLWYAIDMALAAHSFHWDGCPEAKRWQRSPREEAREMLDLARSHGACIDEATLDAIEGEGGALAP